MKYIFHFKEVTTGSVEIISDTLPDRGEIINAIENGSVNYNKTEYEDVRLYDEKPPIESIHGYEIHRSIVFENNRGFALGENPKAVSPFATWQFTENENGVRDYYWGHYKSSKDVATRDYELRVAEYHDDYGLPPRNAYKYYSTQRPVDIGTFPKTENGPVIIINFDERKIVESGHCKAWGYLVYDAPLTEKQISDYELKAAPGNPDKKTIAEQLAEGAEQAAKHNADLPDTPEHPEI